MSFFDKHCAFEYGKKCWGFAAILLAAGLFVGVIIGYAFIVTSAQKVQQGYEVSEQVRRGEITDIEQAQDQMNGKRLKAGGFLSQTKDLLIRVGQVYKEGINQVFGAPPNADIQKSTLLMSGK